MTDPMDPPQNTERTQRSYKAFCSGSLGRRNKNEPRILISFSLPAKDQWILEGIDRLAQMDRVSRSKKVKKALMEYLDRHLPGNPQQPLAFSESLPQHTDVSRLEAGIRFLRTKNKLSLKKIVLITGLSFRQVHKICEDIPGNAMRRPRKFFRLEVYRQKWELFKRGVSPEEAFRF